ncbi:Cysteine desulfurase IscS [bacterium AB1]|nr:Cysteine desulfurase IscS [bacterium AB1]
MFFHVDAAQSYGKLEIDVKKNNITTMSVSGHKIYCFKGVGLLYISNHKKLRMKNLVYGGGQQKYRSGTIHTELIYAFYVATKLIYENMHQEYSRLRDIQMKIHLYIIENIQDVHINGCIDSRRICNNLNYTFLHVEGESIIMLMKKYTISTGSACQSDTLEASNTIQCIKDIESAHSSVRISIGKYTTEKNAMNFCLFLKKTIYQLRKRSPLCN